MVLYRRLREGGTLVAGNTRILARRLSWQAPAGSPLTAILHSDQAKGHPKLQIFLKQVSLAESLEWKNWGGLSFFLSLVSLKKK